MARRKIWNRNLNPALNDLFFEKAESSISFDKMLTFRLYKKGNHYTGKLTSCLGFSDDRPVQFRGDLRGKPNSYKEKIRRKER
jgi:hypothetical protein